MPLNRTEVTLLRDTCASACWAASKAHTLDATLREPELRGVVRSADALLKALDTNVCPEEAAARMAAAPPLPASAAVRHDGTIALPAELLAAEVRAPPEPAPNSGLLRLAARRLELRGAATDTEAMQAMMGGYTAPAAAALCSLRACAALCAETRAQGQLGADLPPGTAPHVQVHTSARASATDRLPIA